MIYERLAETVDPRVSVVEVVGVGVADREADLPAVAASAPHAALEGSGSGVA